MLRFNFDISTSDGKPANIFKYMLCYGLIEVRLDAVQKTIEFKYITCYGQLVKFQIVANKNGSFKYTLCYNSMTAMAETHLHSLYLNTYYVKV